MEDRFDDEGTASDSTIAQILTVRMAAQLDRVQRYRRRVVRRGRPEDVHQLRGALRRLATTAALATDAIELPPRAPTRIRSIVADLGDVRDTDVLATLAIELAGAAPANAAVQLETLAHEATDARGKQLGETRRTLRQPKTRRLLLELRRALRRPPRLPFGFRPYPAAAELLLDAGREHLGAHAGWRIAAVRPAGLTRADDRGLHDLRREVKRQRDAIIVLGGDTAAADQLGRVGVELGRLHDLAKMLRTVPPRYRLSRLSVRLALDEGLARWSADRLGHLQDVQRPGRPDPSGSLTIPPRFEPVLGDLRGGDRVVHHPDERVAAGSRIARPGAR